MHVKRYTAVFLLLTAALYSAPAKKPKVAKPVIANGTPVLWRDPTQISSLNLIYGSGGAENQPHGPYTFVNEDMNGTNPKFHVKDGNGVKWTVKMGAEAKPETAAARITWAAGYFTPDDYFLPQIQVANMQRLKRGWKLVAPDGTVHNVRLKRDEKDEEKKVGDWEWEQNPFVGTRQLNGLKVLMATVNNWDLKDVNNEIVQKGSELIYMVSDLGASFGTAGETRPLSKAKGNVDSYINSKFIRSMTPTTVSFEVPARPSWLILGKSQRV